MRFRLLISFVPVATPVAIIPQLPLVREMLPSRDVNDIPLPVIFICVPKTINGLKATSELVNGCVHNTIATTMAITLIRVSVMGVVSPLVF